MAETSIEWCDYTFNPWRGCTKVAPECAHCYADTMSKRNPKVLGTWGPQGKRVVAAEDYWKQPLRWNKQAKAEGVRRRVFCASLADVFEDWTGPLSDVQGRRLWQVAYAYHTEWGEPAEGFRSPHDRPLRLSDVRSRLFALIDQTPHLDWLLLTKRPENILAMSEQAGPSLRGATGDENGFEISYYRPNVWLGTSAGCQETANRAIPELLRCRHLSPVLFVSCEPMLGAVDLTQLPDPDQTSDRGPWIDALSSNLAHLDWVICGGESGPNARPMHPNWARNLRNQCQAARVPFLFKQWGEWGNELVSGPWPPLSELKDNQKVAYGNGGNNYTLYTKRGKKQAGRLLDGREHHEFPEVSF